MNTLKRATALVAGLALPPAAVNAATVQETLTFDEDDFAFTQETVDETTYDVVRYKEGVIHNVPGEPKLPKVLYSFSIPYGSTVTNVEITASSSETLEGTYYLYPGQDPIPIGYGDVPGPPDYGIDWEWTDPNEDIYEDEDPFPEEILVDNGYGETRGYLLADFSIFPLQYTAEGGELKKLKLYTSVTVRVTYTPPDPAPEADRFEWDFFYDLWGDAVKATVLNPEDVYGDREPIIEVDVMEHGTDTVNGDEIPWVKAGDSEYYDYVIPDDVPGFSDPIDREYPFPFIIVTNDKWWYGDGQNDYVSQPDLMDELDPFVEWKIRKGFPALVVKVDDIDANIYGADIQDKIRNFLKEAFEEWGTEAAFFVGDVAVPPGTYNENWEEYGRYGVVPSRYLCSLKGEQIHASDYYYACLMGNWGPYMEGDVDYYGCGQVEGLDLKPTISVGRLPVGDRNPPGGGEPGSDKTEVANWVTKLLKYEKDPVSGYADDVLFIGSDFGYQASEDLWELGEETHFPGFNRTTVYEGTGPNSPDPTADYPTYPEPHGVVDAMNDGAGITYVATHGYPLCHYVTTHKEMAGPHGYYVQEFATDKNHGVPYGHNMMFAPDLKDVCNDEKYGLLFAYACSTFKYDFSDDEKYECLGEEYLADVDGGGAAYIGATTTASLWTEGIAFDFFEYLTNKTTNPGDDICMIGLAHVLARERLCLSEGNVPMHDAYCCNLGGDPTMTAWTADPESLDMEYDSWEAGLTYTLEVEVKDAVGDPVPDAAVVFWLEDEYYLVEKTNDTGKVRFKELEPFSGGKLTSWKHNYVPALDDDVSVGGD
jgi:hypothetical protein